jgi:hypothetical protein
VAKPLDLMVVHEIADDRKFTSDDLSSAVNQACDVFTTHGFTIDSIYFDGDGVKVKSQHKVDIAGAGDHVPIAERAIRTIEERVTALRMALPYTVSRSLGKHLVRYAATCLNLFPAANDTDRRSPRERLTGVKPTLKSFRNLSFGDYCHVLARISPAQRRATTHARTVGAIAVGPTFNCKGSWNFISLETGNVVRRTWCKRLPIPQDVINTINAFSGPSSSSVVRELPPVNDLPPPLRGGTFNNRFSVLSDDDYDDDNPTAVSSSSDPVVPETIFSGTQPRPVVPDTTFSGTQPRPVVEAAVGVVSQSVAEPSPVNVSEPTVSSEPGVASIIPPPFFDGDDAYDDVDEPDDVVEVTLRRSERLRAKQYLALHATLSESLRTHGEPGRVAVIAEVRQMLNKGVFHMLDPGVNVRTIPSQLFLKAKHDAKGNFVKMKGRLVAGGHRQLRNATDVSSPTVSTEALFTVIAVSAAKGHRIATVDVEAAFLECDIDDEIHMRLPPEICAILVAEDASLVKYRRRDGSIVVKLAKALYGTVQAAKLWYEKLTSVFLSNGFHANNYDRCVFYKRHNGENIMVTVHVDDVLISSTSDVGVKHCVSILTKSFTSINVNYDPVVEYLGMRIESSAIGVSITMPGYTEDCVKAFLPFDSIGKSSTPADGKLFDIDEASPSLSSERREAFHSIVAKVLYLGVKVRPDLLPVTSFLSSRVSKPTESDWSKLRQMLSYLSSTANYGLFYHFGHDVELTAYIDASHGTHMCDGTGRTGVVITLAGGAVCCKSSKQRVVTLSSTEAELVALTEGTNHVLWLRNLMSDLNLIDRGPTLVYEDNTSTISLVVSEKTRQQRTRHLNCKYFAIRERIRDKSIVLQHLSGKEMLADILTKGIDVSTLKRLLPKMMLVME